MSVGTDLLVQVFEAFTTHNTHRRTIRRLFCESGQAAIKSHRFVNDDTKNTIKQIMPKCKDCKHSKLQPRTTVLVFEEFVRIGKPELLKELYIQIGWPSRKAYLFCNQKTQSAIQRLGLQEMYVKGKSLKTKKGIPLMIQPYLK